MLSLVAAHARKAPICTPHGRLKIRSSSKGADVSSWSYRHSTGGLSGRQRLKVVA
jgi:hypothetical protein